jgi:hypothetical protein
VDAKTWAEAALVKLLARCHREAAFELLRWALVLRNER